MEPDRADADLGAIVGSGTMNLDRDFLARIAAETGFRGEMLEKVN